MLVLRKNNRIALPMETLQDIEEALNFPAFLGIPVGATLNDVMVVALSDAKHVWGWRSLARDALRMVYQRYRQPVSTPVDLAPYAGRMLFTWLYPRADMKAFVVPLLNNYERDDYVVLGPDTNMQEQLPGKPAFLTWEQFPEISMDAWRLEFSRCAPIWRERLTDVFRKHGVPSYVGSFLLSHLQTQTQFVMACERFLDQMAPTVIVTEYDRNSYASCLLLAAKKRGIPSVTMVHASAMPYPSYGMAPLVATRVCCWGEVHRDKFRRYGIADEQIVVSGCQATTRVLDADGALARGRFSLAPERPVVLLATSPVQLEVRLHYARVFCEAMAALPSVSAIVRLHPAERLAEYRNVIAEFPNATFLANSAMSRDESLACADLIVSHESSFGVDAVLKGKIVIVLELKNHTGTLKIVKELIDNAGCPRVGDAAELEATVGKVLCDQAWRNALQGKVQQYAARHCVSYGTEAAAQVCQVIDAMVSTVVPMEFAGAVK
jgi:hypothetical protein